MTDPQTQIDFAYSTAGTPGDAHGAGNLLGRSASAFRGWREKVLEDSESGVLGFWSLPTEEALIAQVEALVAQVPSECTDVIVVGIGGSSLGARAIYEALCGPDHLRLPSDGRRLHFPDNSDPWRLRPLLDHLNPESTLLVVISKSGRTLETAVGFRVLFSWMKSRLSEDDARARVITITDPSAGPLRELSHDWGLKSLSIPSNVGGRFSVLSPVGLLPARLAGLDVTSLQQGARRMAGACETAELRQNPAGILAALHQAHAQSGRNISVLMPYADGLRAFALWWCQLWAESLGKRHDRTGELVEFGFTALPATGTTDQHSQLQLFMEGPRDKLISFIELRSGPDDLEIPGGPGPLAYLEGRTMHEVLRAARRATSLALYEDQRPSLTLSIPRIDESTLGELFFLYQATVAFLGEANNINAFDQPGVEAGKVLTQALLGHPDADRTRAHVEAVEDQRTPEDLYSSAACSSQEAP